jgi:uncharacterized protein DUF1579
MRRSACPVLVAIVSLGLALLASAESSYAQEAKRDLFGRPQPKPPQLQVLERLQGNWDVTTTTRAPKALTATYVETYEWVLDQRFLRGETSRKVDGSQDIFMTTFDPATKFYRFWIFNSLGVSIEFPRGTWDEKTQSMEWRSPPQSDLSFFARWTFPDKNTRRWTGLLKDWKGTVLLDMDGTATRRR